MSWKYHGQDWLEQFPRNVSKNPTKIVKFHTQTEHKTYCSSSIHPETDIHKNDASQSFFLHKSQKFNERSWKCFYENRPWHEQFNRFGSSDFTAIPKFVNFILNFAPICLINESSISAHAMKVEKKETFVSTVSPHSPMSTFLDMFTISIYIYSSIFGYFPVVKMNTKRKYFVWKSLRILFSVDWDFCFH